MDIKEIINQLNDLYLTEENAILKMAQIIHKATNEWIVNGGKRKGRFWKLLVLNGCKYTYDTLKWRYYTIDYFTNLQMTTQLPMPFSNYHFLVKHNKLLGKTITELLRCKAEKNGWTHRRLHSEIMAILRKKRNICWCICEKCGAKHKRNGG